ncbi:MAG: hypothetical protein M3Y69_06080 [Verrucomicrobiota bacterium]|nr:hypothetical protein [Verrucomicrobiota bacterium]
MERGVADDRPDNNERKADETLPISSALARFARQVDVPLLLLAVAITLAQILLATLAGRGANWHDRYMSLWTFDGGWYADIINYGYRTTVPPGAGAQYNLGFFPGYPVAAGILANIFHLSAGVALLLTAQIAAVVFWWLLLRILQRWKVASSVTLCVVLLVFSQPGGFFFVVSYPESLAMAALLVLLSLGARTGRSVPMLLGAAAGGYVLSATRIAGAPVAVIPAVWACRDFLMMPAARGHLPRRVFAAIWRHAIVAIATAAGTISFFIFCAVRFGHWDAYTRARAVGWFGAKADYTALLLRENFHLYRPRFAEEFISHNDVSQLYFQLLLLLLVAMPLIDFWLCRRKQRWDLIERLPYYLAGWIFLFVSASGGANLPGGSYTGFFRYGIYTQVPLALAWAHGRRHSVSAERPLCLAAQVLVFLLAAIGIALQAQFCWRYARGVLIS